MEKKHGKVMLNQWILEYPFNNPPPRGSVGAREVQVF
jgi:hypothetical protein